MTKLVDRLGRTGFAALTSLIWAIPMAAWAGSADLSPIDRTAYPGIALAIGFVMLAVWLVLLSRLRHIRITPRQRRFDLTQMSASEKRWTLVAAAFFLGLVAWLNTAATVDWSPLTSAVASGKAGPTLFAGAAVIVLAAIVAGLWASWRKQTSAYRERVASSLSNVS